MFNIGIYAEKEDLFKQENYLDNLYLITLIIFIFFKIITALRIIRLDKVSFKQILREYLYSVWIFYKNCS